jgi:LmbE family N-acetylglucosaminyl deacetylase
MRFVRLVSVLASAALFGVDVAGAGGVPETAKPTKVLLAVLTHPDDEIICAGTLARAAAAGWEVQVIYSTSGDAGVDVQQFQTQRLAHLECHKTQWRPKAQAKLSEFRRDYPFEEYIWAGGGQGAPGKWVGS